MLTQEERNKINIRCDLINILQADGISTVNAHQAARDYIIDVTKLLDALEEAEADHDKLSLLRDEWRSRAEEAESFKQWMGQALKCEVAASTDEIKQQYNLLVQAVNNISDDRNRQKVRAEALERALGYVTPRCTWCELKRENCGHFNPPMPHGTPRSDDPEFYCEHWKFDQARFAEGINGETNE